MAMILCGCNVNPAGCSRPDTDILFNRSAMRRNDNRNHCDGSRSLVSDLINNSPLFLAFCIVIV